MTVSNPKVAMIDNYDLFIWNLYKCLCQESADVQVFQNDNFTIPEIEA